LATGNLSPLTFKCYLSNWYNKHDAEGLQIDCNANYSCPLYVRHLVATDSDCINGLAFYICCRCKTFSLVGVLPQPVDFVPPALHPAQQLKKGWKKKVTSEVAKRLDLVFIYV